MQAATVFYAHQNSNLGNIDLVQDDFSKARQAQDDAQHYATPTPEQLLHYNQGAVRLLTQTIAVQVVGALLVALLAGLVAGWAAAASALAGAASSALPNVLFAMRLLFGMFRPGGASPVSFFLGEFLKLGSTALLLLLAVKVGQDALVWPALLAGLIVALKSQYWLLLFKSS